MGMFWLCLCPPRVCPACLRTAEAGKDGTGLPWGWLSSWGTRIKEPTGKKCLPTAPERVQGANCKLTTPGISSNHLLLPVCCLHHFPALAAILVAPATAHSCAQLLQFVLRAPPCCMDAGKLSSNSHSLQHLSWCKLCMSGCTFWELHWACNCYTNSKKAFCWRVIPSGNGNLTGRTPLQLSPSPRLQQCTKITSRKITLHIHLWVTFTACFFMLFMFRSPNYTSCVKVTWEKFRVIWCLQHKPRDSTQTSKEKSRGRKKPGNMCTSDEEFKLGSKGQAWKKRLNKGCLLKGLRPTAD